jgi:Leucine-rich repeat (LRR) protein
MKQILLILAVVALVGCGEPKKEESAKAKAAAEAKVTEDKSAADWKVIEKAIRKELKKPTGELTKVDLEKVTTLYLSGNQLTEVPKGLEKLTKLEALVLINNQLTDVKGLEKLTQLKTLHLSYNKLTGVKGLEKLTHLEHLGLESNPDLTKAQIAELQKALPKSKIFSNPTK